MTSPADRYRRLAARFTDVVSAVDAASWSNPSPCAEWTASDVLDHVVTTEIGMLAGMPFAPTEAIAAIDTSAPAEAWGRIRDLVQAALDDPGRAEHSYDGYFGPTTFAGTIDRFYSADLLIHSWDIARATGLRGQEALDAAEMLRVRSSMADIETIMRQPGLFDAERTVADDATELDRFIAWTGRDPKFG